MIVDMLRFIGFGRTVIAKGSCFRGGVDGDADIHVFGVLVGDVRTGGAVVVEAGGLLEGNVDATEVVVRGELRGSVRARTCLRVVGGVLEGDTDYGCLEVRNNGTIRGKTRTIPPAIVASTGFATGALEAPAALPLPAPLPASERALPSEPPPASEAAPSEPPGAETSAEPGLVLPALLPPRPPRRPRALPSVPPRRAALSG